MKSIFVSSTFRDMQAERDALMVIAVPELNEYARDCGQAVRLVDLRWGVNTGDLESEEGSMKVLSVCLDEIDESRPYMIVLVGDRYGWIPEQELIKRTAKNKNYSLEDYEKSVTELEIEYGALSDSEQLKRCLFYFREPLPYNKMSQQEREIYLTEDDRRTEKLAELKQKIRNSGATIKSYSLEWNEEQHKVEGLDSFTQMVVEDVKNLLKDEFEKSRKQSWQEREGAEAKLLAENKRSQFSARYDLLKQYLQQTQNDNTRLFILKGTSGSGKSTMLAKMEHELSKEADTLFIACGNGLHSQSADDVLRQVVYYLEMRLGKTEHFGEEIKPEASFDKDKEKTLEEWTERFMNLSYEYSAKSKKELYIVCDALDQLTQNEIVRNFTWLPKALSSAVTMIFSCLDSFELPAFLPYQEKSVIEELNDLKSEEISEVIEGILSISGKKLDNSIKLAVERKKNAVNPLYLSMLLQRLIMLDSDDFGIIAEYGNDMIAINRYLHETIDKSPDALPEMCRVIFKEAAERINKSMCLNVSDLIAVSRRGLRESDLESIFAEEGSKWSSLDFSRFFKYLRPFFVLRGDGRVDFIHKAIREGIADATNIGSVNALIFQHLKALDFEDVVRLNEIVYHAQKADEKMFLVKYIEEANGKSEVIKKLIAEALHENVVDNPEWYKFFFLSVIECGVNHGFVSFCNFDFYDAFTQSMDELELLLILMNEVCMLAGRLAEKEQTPEAYRDLSISYGIIGDIYKIQGKHAKALEIYQKAHTINKRLVEELQTPWAYGDLSVSYSNIGEIYIIQEKYNAALEIYQKNLKISDWLAGIFQTLETYGNLSLIYVKIGDIYKIKGRYIKALGIYQKDSELIECLVEGFHTPETYRNLSILYERIGDIYDIQGKLTEALEIYQKALEIRERLVEELHTLETYRGVSIIYERIGNIYGIQRKSSKAMKMYQKVLEIREWMVEEFHTPEVSGDLAISYAQIGDIYKTKRKYAEALEIYQKALEISKCLAEETKMSMIYRDLSLIYERIGGIYVIQRRDSEALKMFQKTLEIRERIVKEVQRPETYEDLSVSYVQIGNMCKIYGKHSDALKMYRKALKIRERLTEESRTPDTMDLLAHVHYYIAWLLENEQKKEHFNKAFKIWKQLAIEVPDNPCYDQMCDRVQRDISELK